MTNTLRTLAAEAEAAIQTLGHKQSTLAHYRYTFNRIVKIHEQQGKHELDVCVVNEYVKSLEARVLRNELSRRIYRTKKRAAEVLTEFNEKHKIEWRHHTAPKIVLTHYYNSIRDQYLSQTIKKPRCLDVAKSCVTRYFSWLMSHGYETLPEVNAATIQEYMVACSQTLNGRALSNIQYNLKKLHQYLHSVGLVDNNYSKLLSFPISINRKIKPAIPQEEIACTLGAIDRATPTGKRDYAIIMMASVMGLRNGDITNIRFSEIDWRNGEIRLTQSKTEKSLALPLTTDVGEAIKDYIINGRPESDCPEIFLRALAPHKALNSIGSLHQRRRIKAGLNPRGGTHGLRRAAGVNMAIQGVPVTTIAQILGQSDINVTKQYIPLDIRHLKECALDFHGIAPKRGER